MPNKAKELRGQLRQIVLEVLPEVLTQEQFKHLESQIMSRLSELEKQTKEVMQEMNKRHKNTMGMLVRSVSTPSK